MTDTIPNPISPTPSEAPANQSEGGNVAITVAAPDPHEAAANAIIMAGVAATAGMGWLPAFIDIGWLVTANSGMVGSLAVLYQHKWTADNTKSFIQRLIGDGGLTIIAVKALAAALDMTGIGLPVGIAINGAMNGALTLAIGKSAQHYFKNQGEVPDDELIKFFKDVLRRRR